MTARTSGLSAARWRAAAVGDHDKRTPRAVVEVARCVLEVVPGERSLQPEFGWRAHLLAPLDHDAFCGVASLLAEEDLARWVPDLGVRQVEVLSLETETVLLRMHVAEAHHDVRVQRRGRLKSAVNARGGRS